MKNSLQQHGMIAAWWSSGCWKGKKPCARWTSPPSRTAAITSTSPAMCATWSSRRACARAGELTADLAAIPFEMDRQDAQILETNILGTANVLLAAQEAGVRRVVYFSSINAIGQAEPTHPAYLPLDDDAPHHNVHNYSLSKHIGEEMCAAFAARGGLSAVSLRHAGDPARAIPLPLVGFDPRRVQVAKPHRRSLCTSTCATWPRPPRWR